MKIKKAFLLMATLAVSPISHAQTTTPTNQSTKAEENSVDLNNPVSRSMFTLVKFLNTYGVMSGASRVCKPSEQIYIEACTQLTLMHWKDITGVDLNKVKVGDESDNSFRKRVRDEFAQRESQGYQYMMTHSNECQSFYDTEKHAPIWYFCHRHFDDTENKNQPVKKDTFNLQ